MLCCLGLQIVRRLLQSKTLPLSSLALVAGACLDSPHDTVNEYVQWVGGIHRVAVVVMEGSAGYKELYEEWKSAGLTVHSCEVSNCIHTWVAVVWLQRSTSDPGAQLRSHDGLMEQHARYRSVSYSLRFVRSCAHVCLVQESGNWARTQKDTRAKKSTKSQPNKVTKTQATPEPKAQRTTCLVLGFIAPEYLQALRALAVLSPM